MLSVRDGGIKLVPVYLVIPKTVAEESKNWRNWKCPSCVVSTLKAAVPESDNVSATVPENIKSALAFLKTELVSEFDTKFEAMSQILQPLVQKKQQDKGNLTMGKDDLKKVTSNTDDTNTKIAAEDFDRCVLVLKPSQNESGGIVNTPKCFSEVIKSINTCVQDAEVSFCKPKSNTGSIVLGFPNQAERDKVAKQITENAELTNNFE